MIVCRSTTRLMLDPQNRPDADKLNKLADFLATLEGIVVDETNAGVPGKSRCIPPPKALEQGGNK